MIEVVIDNRLRMDGLDEPVRAALRKLFTHTNPEAKKLEAMGKKYHKEPATYETWHEDGEAFSLPRGGLSRLRDVFDDFDLDYSLTDNRSDGIPSVTGSFIDPWQLGMDLFPEHKLVAWEHQDEMVAAAKQYGQVLMRAPTGSGKTSALLKLIAELQVPALVIMWETGLLRQWQKRVEVELGIPRDEQGLIQGKHFRLKPITLAMQQTLARWDDAKWDRMWRQDPETGLWKCVFGGVYCDEVQRYAANTFVGQIDRFDSKYRVGVSADERRKDRKTFLIYDMFGKPRVKIEKAALVEKRIIHEVECYVMPTNFSAQWYVDKREAKEQDVQDFNQLLDEMEADADRNKLAVHLLHECVQAGLPSLSFTHRVDHARKIDAALTALGVASGLALGGNEWSDTFDETIAGLNDGKLQVGCGTFGKLGVGHDIPAVAAGVAVTPVHNNRGFLTQVKGRICRTTQGKENARIIVLWDHRVFGELPLINLKRWNEVCKVWCEWDRRWKDIGIYMMEQRQHGRRSNSTDAATETDIFKQAPRPGRRQR